MKFFEIVESILGKGLSKTLVIIGCTVWVSFWFADKTRDFEKALLKEFANTEARNIEQDARINLAWTVQMMVARDTITARWNPTNPIPDAWRIYHDIRNGREPIGVRITP